MTRDVRPPDVAETPVGPVHPGRVLRNVGAMAIGRILGDLSTFILLVVVSRAFGQEGVGAYSFAIALTGAIVVLADLGLYNMSIKWMSQNIELIKEHIGVVLSVRLLLSVLTTGLILLVTLFLPFSTDVRVIVAIIGVHQILLTLAKGIGTVFVAREQMHLAAALDCGGRMFGALGGSMVALAWGDLVLAMAVLPVATAIQVAISLRLVARDVGRPPLTAKWPVMRAMLLEARPFGLGLLISQMAARVDVVLLGLILSAAAAGVYNVAYRVVFLALFMPHFVSLALLPMVSRLYVSAPAQVADVYQRSLQVITLVGLPASAGLCLIAGDLVSLSFGAEFSESSVILQWLSWMVLLGCWRAIMATFLTAGGRQRERVRCEWTAAWVNVIGNAALIPLIGTIGAAVTTLVAEICLVSLLAGRLAASLGSPSVGPLLVKGGLATGAFVIPLILWPLPMALAVPVAMMIYVATVSLFRDVRQDILRLLSNITAKHHA